MTNRIAELIKQEKITSAKFAFLIGVQPSAVSHLLSGRNKPSLDVVQRILNTFRAINPDWLISGIGDMYRKGGEHTNNQQVKVNFEENKLKMPSLFPDDLDNEPKNEKENEIKQPSYAEKNISPNSNFTSNVKEQILSTKEEDEIIEKTNSQISTENKETKKEEPLKVIPPRIVKKIVVFYSDNTYEEYGAQLNNV